MFERYTQKARLTILFALHEASQYGSPYIETEHLLLGLLHEDESLRTRLHDEVDSIRRRIEDHTGRHEKVPTSRHEKIPTKVDLPLSYECRRVLAYAAEESGRRKDKHIGTEHLLFGLLREEKCYAAEILHERGLVPDANSGPNPEAG